MGKIIVPQELQDQIVELYKKGKCPKKIVEILSLSFSEDKVRKILRENNVKLRTLQEARAVMDPVDYRKYKINDNYNFESHNGAWLLGFIASDGYLPNTKGAHNRITIALAAKDRDILELIR